MSAVELGVSFLALITGYWLVSVVLDWIAARKSAKSESPGSGSATFSGTGRTSTPRELDLNDPSNWRAVLEVSETDSLKTITAAYKRKIAEYHPDKVACMGSEIRALAELRSKQINAAYDFARRRHR